MSDTDKRTQQFRYAVWLATQDGQPEEALKVMQKVAEKGDKSAFFQEQIEARKLLAEWDGTPEKSYTPADMHRAAA